MRTSSITPRKQPKQKRSEMVVESLIEATARIFSTLGAAKASTNLIAEKAGVSIGSLYQYFPNKGALIAQLIEKEQIEFHQNVRKKLNEYQNEPLEVTIRDLSAFIVDEFFRRKPLLPQLIIQAIQLQLAPSALERRAELIQFIEKFLRSREKDLPRKEGFDKMAYTLSHAMIGLLDVASLQGFKEVSPSDLQREIEHLLKGYLLYVKPH